MNLSLAVSVAIGIVVFFAVNAWYKRSISGDKGLLTALIIAVVVAALVRAAILLITEPREIQYDGRRLDFIAMDGRSYLPIEEFSRLVDSKVYYENRNFTLSGQSWTLVQLDEHGQGLLILQDNPVVILPKCINNGNKIYIPIDTLEYIGFKITSQGRTIYIQSD